MRHVLIPAVVNHVVCNFQYALRVAIVSASFGEVGEVRLSVMVDKVVDKVVDVQISTFFVVSFGFLFAFGAVPWVRH